jgi:hypothetical protein
VRLVRQGGSARGSRVPFMLTLPSFSALQQSQSEVMTEAGFIEKSIQKRLE